MKQYITNSRTFLSAFINQVTTASWVALASNSCSSVVFTCSPSAVAGVNNSYMVRRGAAGGQVYVGEGEVLEIGVNSNSSELQIQSAQGTPTAGMECRTYNGDIVPPIAQNRSLQHDITH
jgi:hypothetical protein